MSSVSKLSHSQFPGPEKSTKNGEKEQQNSSGVQRSRSELSASLRSLSGLSSVANRDSARPVEELGT